MKKYFALIALVCAPAVAQHQHHTQQHDAVAELLMQQASGTSTNPAAAPMHMSMMHIDKWMLMFHGMGYVSQVVQTSPQGADELFSTNWIMGMAERPLAGGHLMLRSMLSLEPVTVRKRGYPEIFQTGEGLIDRQHPHDLFMELAAEFAMDVGHQTIGYIYAAPVGDPALGPVAFPHRASAMEIPQATLSHHLQDSTHIASSVLTIGAKQNPFGLAISAFHGREPDDNRWNIDKGSLDSWSVRATWDPTPNWSAQISTGHLEQPEATEAGHIHRTTASVSHSTGDWSSSLIWGWNHKQEHETHGIVAETNFRFNQSHYVTGRLEVVDKDELLPTHDVFTVKALTLGYTKDIFRSRDLLGGVGGNVTVFGVPEALKERYGNRPLSFYVFARVRAQ